MSIDYETRKCKGCEKVYVNSFIFDCPNEPNDKDANFILCPSCAVEVYQRMKKLHESLDK